MSFTFKWMILGVDKKQGYKCLDFAKSRGFLPDSIGGTHAGRIAELSQLTPISSYMVTEELPESYTNAFAQLSLVVNIRPIPLPILKEALITRLQKQEPFYWLDLSESSTHIADLLKIHAELKSEGFTNLILILGISPIMHTVRSVVRILKEQQVDFNMLKIYPKSLFTERTIWWSNLEKERSESKKPLVDSNPIHAKKLAWTLPSWDCQKILLQRETNFDLEISFHLNNSERKILNFLEKIRRSVDKTFLLKFYETLCRYYLKQMRTRSKKQEEDAFLVEATSKDGTTLRFGGQPLDVLWDDAFLYDLLGLITWIKDKPQITKDIWTYLDSPVDSNIVTLSLNKEG